VQERLALLRGLSNGLAALFTGLAGITVVWLAIRSSRAPDRRRVSGAAAFDGNCQL